MEQEYSKETLEILGKVPSCFIRYGLSVFFILLIGILVGLSKIHYYDTFKTQVIICEADHLNDSIIGSSKYIAHMEVNISDIWKIKIGSDVIISLNQYPKNVYGVIFGYVVCFSQNNEKQVYDVYIQLPNELMTSFNNKLEYLPDMSGIALIKGERRSIFKRIFSKSHISVNLQIIPSIIGTLINSFRPPRGNQTI
ncbi:MAG: hypothetical protein BGO34_19870 [Bacteroidia bacterium 44-10]|nr:MAG: hypothetical protein BGO34_19870 [Bacteroidia bacterium 44-10]